MNGTAKYHLSEHMVATIKPFEFGLSEMDFELCFTEFEVPWHGSIASYLD